MLRHLLLGIGITLIILSLVLINVEIPANKAQLTREEIINKAKELGMMFPGEDYKRGFFLDPGVNLKESLLESSSEQAEDESDPETEKIATEKMAAEEQTGEDQRQLAADQVITIVVSSGMRAQEVAELLVRKGLLQDGEAFLKLLEKFEVENKIMAGRYEFSSNVSELELLFSLTAG
jgi:rhodanese-related sulfurtransferase